MSLKGVLGHPAVYQAFQRAGGFFGARIKAIAEHLPIRPDDKLIDVGCGPGFLLDHLPDGVHYVGFDTDADYIDYARKRFGTRGEFVCAEFSDALAQDHGPADVIMMNGVLHHLDDAVADRTLATISRAVNVEGTLFTLDGCYIEEQSWLIRYLLQHDRGAYVRDRAGYQALLTPHFASVDVHISSSLSRIPYTFITMIARNPRR